MLSEFKKFLLRGNVVDLAVAVVIGGAFTNIVNALVKDLITPLISAVGSQPNFENLNFTFSGSTFAYGDFLNALISFLILAAVVFFFVVTPINRLMAVARSKKEPEDPTTKKCPECLSEIPIKATRCMYCTTKLTPEQKTAD